MDSEAPNPFQDWLEGSRAFLEGASLSPELTTRCQALFDTWRRFGSVLSEAGQKSGQGAAPGGPFDPSGWIDLAGAGGFGDLWALFGAERRVLEESAEWAAYGAALNRYRAVLGRAWLAAFTRFATKMTEDAGDAPPDFRAMQSAWQQAADAELAAAQRGADYVAAQNELIRSRLACAQLLRRRADEVAGLIGLPTRAEVENLRRRVHELERALRLGDR